MDEAEKYKQRLEAIAEKRRQQEEEDKARREMEDEKLRVQQLKRKSLRDQWLSEGAPLSPTALDSQIARTQTHDMKNNVDKFQSENPPLTEEEEKLEDLMEEGLTEERVAEDAAEMIQDVVQNGESPNGADTEDKLMETPNSTVEETANVSINGEELEANGNHNALRQNGQSNTNGPIEADAAVVDMKLEQELNVDEQKPDHTPNYDVNEEEEEDEGTLVMRAECVIITDEGDDASLEEHEDFAPQVNETLSEIPEEGRERAEAAEEILKTETAPETFTEKFELTTEPRDKNADMDCSINAGSEVEGQQDMELEEMTSAQLQSSVDALEGTTVALVPVYTEVQLSVISPVDEAEAEAETAPAQQDAEAAFKTEEPACQPGQFLDVSLADPQENHRTAEGPPGEQEPLLLVVKGSSTMAQPAGVQSPVQAPSQGDDSKSPKRKSCQCCSVM